MQAIQSKYHTIRGTKVHYLESGTTENKPTYVVVHGLFGEARALEPFIQSLGRCRVIAIDLPGQGDSSTMRTTHTLKHFAWVISEVIEKLSLHNVVLVGHSYGAIVALTAATQHPQHISRLVMLNPYPQYTLNIATTFYQVTFEIGKRLPGSLKQKMFHSRRLSHMSGRLVLHTQDQALRRAIDESGYASRLKADVSAGQQVIDDFKKFRFDAPLRKLAIPTLAIDGDADALANIDKYISNVVNNTISYQVALDAGHLFPLECPGRAAQMVLDWLVK